MTMMILENFLKKLNVYSEMFGWDEEQKKTFILDFYKRKFNSIKDDFSRSEHLKNLIIRNTLEILESKIEDKASGKYEKRVEVMVYEFLINIKMIKKKILQEFLSSTVNFKFNQFIEKESFLLNFSENMSFLKLSSASKNLNKFFEITKTEKKDLSAKIASESVNLKLEDLKKEINKRKHFLENPHKKRFFSLTSTNKSKIIKTDKKLLRAFSNKSIIQDCIIDEKLNIRNLLKNEAEKTDKKYQRDEFNSRFYQKFQNSFNTENEDNFHVMKSSRSRERSARIGNLKKEADRPKTENFNKASVFEELRDIKTKDSLIMNLKGISIEKNKKDAQVFKKFEMIQNEVSNLRTQKSNLYSQRHNNEEKHRKLSNLHTKQIKEIFNINLDNEGRFLSNNSKNKTKEKKPTLKPNSSRNSHYRIPGIQKVRNLNKFASKMQEEFSKNKKQFSPKLNTSIDKKESHEKLDNKFQREKKTKFCISLFNFKSQVATERSFEKVANNSKAICLEGKLKFESVNALKKKEINPTIASKINMRNNNEKAILRFIEIMEQLKMNLKKKFWRYFTQLFEINNIKIIRNNGLSILIPMLKKLEIRNTKICFEVIKNILLCSKFLKLADGVNSKQKFHLLKKINKASLYYQMRVLTSVIEKMVQKNIFEIFKQRKKLKIKKMEIKRNEDLSSIMKIKNKILKCTNFQNLRDILNSNCKNEKINISNICSNFNNIETGEKISKNYPKFEIKKIDKIKISGELKNLNKKQHECIQTNDSNVKEIKHDKIKISEICKEFGKLQEKDNNESLYTIQINEENKKQQLMSSNKRLHGFIDKEENPIECKVKENHKYVEKISIADIYKNLNNKNKILIQNELNIIQEFGDFKNNRNSNKEDNFNQILQQKDIKDIKFQECNNISNHNHKLKQAEKKTHNHPKNLFINKSKTDIILKYNEEIKKELDVPIYDINNKDSMNLSHLAYLNKSSNLNFYIDNENDQKDEIDNETVVNADIEISSINWSQFDENNEIEEFIKIDDCGEDKIEAVEENNGIKLKKTNFNINLENAGLCAKKAQSKIRSIKELTKYDYHNCPKIPTNSLIQKSICKQENLLDVKKKEEKESTKFIDSIIKNIKSSKKNLNFDTPKKLGIEFGNNFLKKKEIELSIFDSPFVKKTSNPQKDHKNLEINNSMNKLKTQISMNKINLPLESNKSSNNIENNKKRIENPIFVSISQDINKDKSNNQISHFSNPEKMKGGSDLEKKTISNQIPKELLDLQKELFLLEDNQKKLNFEINSKINNIMTFN